MSGTVPGAGARESAVAVAGALAELGVQRVRLRGPRGARELAARTTDLPGEVLRAGACEIEVDTLGVVVRFDADRAEWTGESADFDRALARAV